MNDDMRLGHEQRGSARVAGTVVAIAAFAVALLGAVPAAAETVPAATQSESSAPETEPSATEAEPSATGAEKPATRSGALNGFVIAAANEHRQHIRSGGPGRDAIHSVDTPEFARATEASWAPPPVGAIGIEVNGVARAYPVHLMEYHQIVNDTIGGVPVAVTFDPLTGIPIAWKREVEGRVLAFGVSGLLYREQFLLFDRETESLWAQYEGVAVAGPLAGKKLERVPSRQEPIGAWVGDHPGSTVLVRPELKKIDYRYSPFKGYWVSDKVPVPVRARDDRYHPKEVVLGLEVNGRHRAYLGSILTSEGGRIVDTFEGVKIRVLYDSNLSLFMYEIDGEPDADPRVTDAYWFAWKSLHPDTEIWHDEPTR